jgi:hypothetical protein
MRVLPPTLSLIAALGLAACGGAEPTGATTPAPASPAPTAAAPSATSTAEPSTPAPGASPATPAAPPPAGAFSTFTNEQKLQHMKTVIKPTMGKLFTAFDPKDFADFGCATCHGEKKEDTHKVLPKLTLSGDGFKKLSTAKPAIMKFMAEQVTPTMATAMGEKPFDPVTHKGFGCGGCHTVQ